MERLILFISSLLFAVCSLAAPNKERAKADTFLISNTAIVKFESEKYITGSGSEKERWFAYVKSSKLPKNSPTKAHISKRDYTYAHDANNAGMAVEMLYILKNGNARIVCGKHSKVTTRKGESTKPQTNDELCVKKIIKVKDGDTFDYLSCGGKVISVRLSGIDAPEKGGKAFCGQPMSQKSKEKLAELLNSGEVKLIRTGTSHDRIVCEVYADEVNVCLEMVKAGMAWREPHFDTQNKYVDAEMEAKNAKSGIWSMSKPLEPWKWRRLTKEEKVSLCK